MRMTRQIRPTKFTFIIISDQLEWKYFHSAQIEMADGYAWQIPPLNCKFINIWWAQFLLLGGGQGCHEVYRVIWNRFKPKRSFCKSDTKLHWGNENLVGKMQQFVGETNQFVGELKQFVGEMKQICWGNEANGWGNEAKCVGEMPRR